MEIDTDRVDEAALGLLYLTLHDGNRAWKGMDWDVSSRLHAKGLIESPVNKAKSVVFTSIGLEKAERIFETMFAKPDRPPRAVQYGGKTAQVTAAAGMKGILCRRATDGDYFFRVYGVDGGFKDYELRHDDLAVTIAPDALAACYRIGDTDLIDHSPEVLGLKVVD